MNKTLGIITVSYLRPNVLRLWCASINRIREQLDMFIPAVVVSDESDKRICNNYHIAHITQQNKPVTEKFNRAMGYMRNIGQTNVMILGSDDIVSTDFVRKTLVEVEKGIDLIYVETFYFFCGQGLDRGKLVRLTNKQIKGIGKTVSSRVLDQCDWRPWNRERSWGMDAIANKVFLQFANSKSVVEDMIVDVKTRDNLNSFRIWSKRLPQEDPQRFYDILSDEELKILKAL